MDNSTGIHANNVEIFACALFTAKFKCFKFILLKPRTKKRDKNIFRNLTETFFNAKYSLTCFMDFKERSADGLLNACKYIDLAVNPGKSKYMEIGRRQGMIANAHIKIGRNSYEKVKTFKYLGSILTKFYSGGNKM